MTHCPRPNCGGSLVADFDNGLVCMSCGRSPDPVVGPRKLRRGEFAYLQDESRPGRPSGSLGVTVDGERLVELRREQRLTRTELARAANVNYSTVRNAEFGRTMTRVCAARIAAALGVDASEFVNKEEIRG